MRVPPDFFIPSIDNPNVNYTKNLFIGKYLLIHFWKLEDDKNINQLRYISESYDMFYEEPFEILSICLENDVEKVQNFRKTSWQMPWQNGVETMLMNGKLAKLFELKQQIPYCILVAPDGTIIEITQYNFGIIKKYYEAQRYNILAQFIKFVAYSSFLCEYSAKRQIISKEEYEEMFKIFTEIYLKIKEEQE